MAERVDWVEIHDPRSEEPMFANIRTGECLWEPPSTASVKKSSKNQWWELYDENTRRYYYYNAHTKQTEWRRPKESEIITLAKLQNLTGKRSKRRSSSSRKSGSQRRRSSSSRKDGEPSSHGDGDRGSLPRKYSKHNSKENLAQLRKHSRSSGHSKQSRGHSSKDSEEMSHNERRESGSSSRTRSNSGHSSAELREVSGSFGEQIGQEKDETSEILQGDSENELGSIQDGSITDMDISSLHEMESTTRDIEYLKISGEITDESETNDTSFFKTDNISSGRRSNCSMNQSNYVSDGPLSESETSALNDSFYSCASKFEEANSEEKLEILVSGASPPKEEELEGSCSPQDSTGEIKRTCSFFNKMVDKDGNLRPVNINEDVSKKRHASEGENDENSPALVLRGERGGRRRSSSLDCKSYDNVSYSIYDNLGRTSDQEFIEEDNISLTDKLTCGGMPHETAALVEACDPIRLELPTIVEPESPTISHALNQPQSEGDVKAMKQAQENGRVVVGSGFSKPPRPLNPPPSHNQPRTKPISRSNTCPTSPNRVPPHVSSNIFSEPCFSDQRRSLFGKKDNISGMLVHSRAPIKKPVINTRDKKIKKEAVELFKLVQVYMGDRSARNKAPSITLSEIVTKAWANQPLRDELYFQLIKQTTDNNISSSLKLGWELMAVCLAMFPPSTKYHSHLEGYVYRHLKDNQKPPANPILQQEISNLVAQYAENCYFKLEKMAKTGSRKGQRKPTQEEVDAAKKAIFHPSMFGSTLDDTMQMQKSRFPDSQLPWILTCLTDQVIRNQGTCTEGIFRVPGDIDEVNALKVKTDTWAYPEDVTDPNVAASLLKQWFRDLKEPLIDESAYERCVSSCDDETVSRAIVYSLPQTNQLVLYYIMDFLQIFCDPQVIRVTKMDVNNLAMVWAPNFLRCPSNEPQVILENTRKEMTFVRTLLTSLDTSTTVGVK